MAKLAAGFPIEVQTARLSRLHFPGLEQRRLPVLSHFNDEIREARYRELLDVRLCCIRDVYPEHGPMGGNQDAVAFLVDIDDGAIETFFLGKAGGYDQAEEEETGADSKKSRAHV